jgi:hypothetical protein
MLQLNSKSDPEIGRVNGSMNFSSIADNNFFYFSDDNELNHWMLAMIGIGCIFIAFVGVSIYLMW